MASNLLGRTFDRWTVLERSENRGKTAYWKCRCSCGTIRDVAAAGLTQGVSKSCGCLRLEIIAKGSKPTLDLSGCKFGRLTAVKLLPGRNASGKRQWLCACECGREVIVSTNALRKGNTKSCGCLKVDVVGASRRTHGRTGTPEYVSWCAMKARCNNENNQDFALYGGRGIKVCDQWEHSFETFLADMGPQPRGKNTIERVNTDGHYCPDNCCWASQKQQTRNKRKRRLVTVGGRTQTIGEWADENGLTYRIIQGRLDKGWSPERAVQKI